MAWHMAYGIWHAAAARVLIATTNTDMAKPPMYIDKNQCYRPCAFVTPPPVPSLI
jgi:hypothetical protein